MSHKHVLKIIKISLSCVWTGVIEELTPRRRIRHESLTASEVFRIFIACYTTRRFSSVCAWSLSWAGGSRAIPSTSMSPKYSVSSKHSDRGHRYVHSISSCVLRSPLLHNRIVHFSVFYLFLPSSRVLSFYSTVVLSTLFSDSCSVCFTLRIQNHVSHPLRTGELEKLGDWLSRNSANEFQ